MATKAEAAAKTALDKSALLRLLTTAKAAAAADAARPILSAVRIVRTADSLIVTGADNYRLAEVTEPVLAGEPWEVVITLDDVKRMIALVKMVPKHTSPIVTLNLTHLGGTLPALVLDAPGAGVTGTFRSLEGKYPDVDPVFARSEGAKAEVAFDPRLMAGLMASFTGSTVKMTVQGPSRPILFDAPSMRAALMPVRTEATPRE